MALSSDLDALKQIVLCKESGSNIGSVINDAWTVGVSPWYLIQLIHQRKQLFNDDVDELSKCHQLAVDIYLRVLARKNVSDMHILQIQIEKGNKERFAALYDAVRLFDGDCLK